MDSTPTIGVLSPFVGGLPRANATQATMEVASQEEGDVVGAR
jgi:hypothetical protein